MTHVVEHNSFRYSWELVRHTYLLDLENEIDIQQVELSPSRGDHLLPRPWPRTSFFEVEIDQIQKHGKTVFSFRNICPVEISRRPDWNPFRLVRTSGNIRVIQRFQSQEGDTETRWLYTDDFFLISLSSGDRHDLSMLLSLIIGKLNTIGLSVQSGKRIRSEFENQQQYREDMSSMFAGGVDGAFRDVKVYQQHGEMTGQDIDVSAALMSAELQDLNAAVASGWSTVAESPAPETPPAPEAAPEEPAEEAAESTETPGPMEECVPADEGEESPPLPLSESTAGNSVAPQQELAEETVPATDVPGLAPAGIASDAENVTPGEEIPAKMPTTAGIVQEPVPAGDPDAAGVPEENSPDESVLLVVADTLCAEEETVPAAGALPVVTERSGLPMEIVAESIIVAVVPETADGTEEIIAEEGAPAAVPDSARIRENTAAEPMYPAGRICGSCGAAIAGTKKFCGSCGAAVAGTPAVACVPAGRTCKHCGAEVSETKKFCGSCGAAVVENPAVTCAPAARTCDQCGAAVSGTKKFCGSCGAEVGRSSPAGGKPAEPPEADTPVSSDAASPGTAAGPAPVNLKSIEELEDLSWLSD